MRFDNGLICYTPGDLRSFMTCQLDSLRRVDALLGRAGEADADAAPDPLGERLGEVGLTHQERVLKDYLRRYGRWRDGRQGGVAVLPPPAATAAAPSVAAPDAAPSIHDAAAEAVAMLHGGAQVLSQVPIAAGRLYGAADFLVQVGERWQLVEVRLGLRVKDVYLAQVGALALGLLSRGVPLDAEALLVNGDGAHLPVPLIEAMDRAREVIADFDAAIEKRMSASEPASWDDDSIAACGWCATCLTEMTAVRDVRLTAGLRMPDRALLRAGGVRTIDELATTERPVEGMDADRFTTLRSQARLQVRQMPPGTEGDPSLQLPPVFEVYDETALRALPTPDLGDVFFDFESDPLWTEPGSDVRGLHYLFGSEVIDAANPYIAFWAHDREEERKALHDFVLFVKTRLRHYPGLHIYHYGNYETMVLRELTRRFEYEVTTLDEWIASGLFVDLLPTVKSSLRTSQSGYGLKKIEPLYMGSELRTGSVLDGAASVAGYQRFAELRAAGEFGAASAVLESIADYNRYDCVSTLRLRDWLRSLIGSLPDEGSADVAG